MRDSAAGGGRPARKSPTHSKMSFAPKPAGIQIVDIF
jgi:hypothetical protein